MVIIDKQYKCNECGYEFEEPRIVRESRGEYWGAPAYEDYPVCPACGGDFVEMHKCACGEWTTDRFCTGCMSTAKIMLVQLFEKLENDRGFYYSDAVDLAVDAMEELEG